MYYEAGPIFTATEDQHGYGLRCFISGNPSYVSACGSLVPKANWKKDIWKREDRYWVEKNAVPLLATLADLPYGVNKYVEIFDTETDEIIAKTTVEEWVGSIPRRPPVE